MPCWAVSQATLLFSPGVTVSVVLVMTWPALLVVRLISQWSLLLQATPSSTQAWQRSKSPSSQVELFCRRCKVPFGLSVVGLIKLLKPPFLWDPIRDRLWARCPACQRRAWIEVRKGQALRALLDRRPGA
jgi:hypothetical protein